MIAFIAAFAGAIWCGQHGEPAAALSLAFLSTSIMVALIRQP
jgi:hypothetical protein